MYVEKEFKLNTSNKNKLAEYRSFGLNCDTTSFDVEEPLSDELTIIRYKATKAGERIIVEDSTFFVEGTDIGVDIRFRIDNLKNHIGKRAKFTIMLGYLFNNKVYVFESHVFGTICTPVRDGWDIDPYFKPDGSEFTRAEYKPKETNPRYICFHNLVNNNPTSIEEPLYTWSGEFQK